MSIVDDLLTDLDGRPLVGDAIVTLLQHNATTADVRRRSVDIVGVEVEPDSERRWPQSHSAQLRLTLAGNDPAMRVFLKKVVASDAPSKPLAALRRDLGSNRCEARFYREFATELRANGAPVVEPLLVDERLDVLDDRPQSTAQPAKRQSEDDGDEPQEQEQERTLRRGGVLLLLRSAEGSFHSSPLDGTQARESLGLLAALHAAAWERAPLLERASERLHACGGTWALSQRGVAELRRAHELWPQFLEAFEQHDPVAIGEARATRRSIAARLEAIALWVAAKLRVRPTAAFATLIHGDAKAANMLRARRDVMGGDVGGDGGRVDGGGGGDGGDDGDDGDGYDRGGLLCDFQWVGVGVGMSDVAYHLIHSVGVDALDGDGDEQLLDAYLRALRARLPPTARAAYTDAVAWRHYRLAFVDYARHLFCHVVTDASAAAFDAKNASARAANIGLLYRDPRVALRLVAKLGEYLSVLEAERREDDTCEAAEVEASGTVRERTWNL